MCERPNQTLNTKTVWRQWLQSALLSRRGDSLPEEAHEICLIKLNCTTRCNDGQSKLIEEEAQYFGGNYWDRHVIGDMVRLSICQPSLPHTVSFIFILLHSTFIDAAHLEIYLPALLSLIT